MKKFVLGGILICSGLLVVIAITVRMLIPPQVQAQIAVNPTQAQINFSSSGDNTVLTTPCSKTTRVVQMWFINSDAATATNIIFKDGATALNPAARFTSGGSFFAAYNDKAPWIITTAGHSLVFNSSAAAQISGEIWYVCTVS